MAITVGALLYRKQGMTEEAFKSHLEMKHVPLVLSLVGEAGQPISTARYFLARRDGKPLVFHGDADKVEWDCYSVFNFRDQEHAMAFKKGYDQHQEEIKADEARFLDLERTVVAGYLTESA